MIDKCNYCEQRREITNTNVSIKGEVLNYCDDCYYRVYFLPQKEAEEAGIKAARPYIKTKLYISACYRVEVLAAVELLLIRLGVPNIKQEERK